MSGCSLSTPLIPAVFAFRLGYSCRSFSTAYVVLSPVTLFFPAYTYLTVSLAFIPRARWGVQ